MSLDEWCSKPVRIMFYRGRQIQACVCESASVIFCAHVTLFYFLQGQFDLPPHLDRFATNVLTLNIHPDSGHGEVLNERVKVNLDGIL